MPPLVVLARHGETEWSASGRHTGRTDIGLTAHGEEEARRLGVLLPTVVDVDDAAVFSSPLVRAQLTAAIALPGMNPIITPHLAEYDYGTYEGLTTLQIQEQVAGWDLYSHGCPGGETVDQVGDRADAFVAQMTDLAAGRPVVAFTHGHLSRILTARLLGFRADEGIAFWNDTATAGVLRWRRGRYVIEGWNRR